jgi:UDP-2-acetamido-2,6-beta-L-arabino-hexul-4-ose reductase
VSRDLAINITDPQAVINLLFVDDIIECFMTLFDDRGATSSFVDPPSPYQITVGELAKQITRFAAIRDNLMMEPVGAGLVRALYSTYVSYLPTNCFSYPLPQHADARGVFVEMMKTPDAGQFSFFTARPGMTRGGHYHNTKTEKFLVIIGNARFRFRHMFSEEFYELHANGEEPMIVETIPGWAHDVTNVGESDLICMLWANEIFDRNNPDTFQSPLKSICQSLK